MLHPTRHQEHPAGMRLRQSSSVPAPASDPLSPGQILAGRFRIQRRVAVGGMGVVYEALDERLHRRIALKCAKPGHATLLSPEVRLATELSHPNLCKIYEIHTADSSAGSIEFFTMEFLEGETLSQRLRRGKLAEKEARAIALQLCGALAEAHRNKVIHGDLKSSNIILTHGPDGAVRAVITDFGLARADGERGFRGGTPAYMAPELRAGAPTSVATDIYALGVILHELACGFRPDQLSAAAETTVTIEPSSNTAELKPEPRRFRRKPRKLPLEARWQHVLKRCLDVDPRQRFQSVHEIIRALGPSVLRRRLITAVATLALTLVSAGVAHQWATAPPETVRLSVEPGSEELVQEAYQQIARLNGTQRLGFQVSYGRKVKSTHSLTVTASPAATGIAVRVRLDDLRSKAPMVEWSMEYRPDELRYAPVSIAGVVSRAFQLNALTDYATVNSAAAPAWREGVALTRDDNRLDDAAKRLQEAASADPDSALVYAALAEVYRRKYFLTKDRIWTERAREWLHKAEVRNSDCAAVHSIAGLMELDQARREAALSRLQRAIQFPALNSDVYRRMGNVHRQNGQYLEALQAFTKAAELEPNYFLNYQEIGALHQDRAEYIDGAKAFERAVQLAPMPVPGLHAALARAYQNQGRFAEAEKQLMEVLRLKVSAPPYFELGQLNMYQRRDNEAIQWFRKALESDPKDYFAWMYLGLCHERTHCRIEARQIYRRAIRLTEEEIRARPRNGYGRSILACLCARTGQRTRAESEAIQAIQLTPSKSETIWMTALTWEVLGKRTAALEVLAAAPLTLLMDLQRWPEASKLTADPGFVRLLQTKTP